jgi:uncharacterized membrane protein YgdD (TMEM256/DUF423 family)
MTEPLDIPPRVRFFLVMGCLGAGLGVVMGAFGAHGLEAHLSAESMEVYQTAVLYQFLHSLGLLAVALIAWRLPASRLTVWA